MKLKVLERSTGYKKVEEWTFLPKGWNYWLKPWDPESVIFEKTFALLRFDTRYNSPSSDDILILNLVTRKLFWMRNRTVRNQIMEKVAGRIELRNLHVSRPGAYGMIVENDRLLVQYKIFMANHPEKRAATIG